MSEKRKGKKAKTEEKPTKEEYAVAKYLKFSLPDRDGKLHGMEVKCFIGNAAVDKLMESKWSASKNQKDPIFTSRNICVAYMLRLLEKGLFHRAERSKPKSDREKEKTKKKKSEKDAEKEDSVNPDEEVRERKGKKDKKSRKQEKQEKEAEANTEDSEKKVEKKEEKEKTEKTKKLKRLKLVMPDQQFFEDGDEVFVWIYDPINAKNFIIGLLMVLGAISLCMFPLWPEEVRIGVYYLSVAAAGFVGFILSLVVVRLILFCCIWVITLGRHHFWMLPNLTEDVGFFDSFRPLYKHESMTGEDPKAKAATKKKKEEEKAKEKGPSEDKDKKGKSVEKEDSDEFEVIKKEDIEGNGGDEDDDKEGEETNEDLDDEEDEDTNLEENTEEEDTEPKKTK